MKIQYFVLSTLYILSIDINSQVPDNYYKNVDSKSGEELKSALYNIIKGHVEFNYTYDYIDSWDILKETVRDSLNTDNVILIYSGRSVNGAQEYNNAKGWTREHVWAKSRGDFGTSKGPGTDINNLKPCDVSINSLRNNRAFSKSNVPVFDDGIFTGCYYGDYYTFEPRDSVKGDIARIVFYMSTRYEGENGEPDLELTNLVLDQNDKQPLHGVLSDLLLWNELDPVDNFERKRNEVIFKYQKNRNPYIDHPEWISLIWGTNTGNRELLQKEAIKKDDSVLIFSLIGEKLFVGKYSDFLSEIKFKNGLYILHKGSVSEIIMKY